MSYRSALENVVNLNTLAMDTVTTKITIAHVITIKATAVEHHHKTNSMLTAKSANVWIQMQNLLMVAQVPKAAA